MSNAPFVDIFLATFNGADYLDQQVHSILEQTYPHIHLTIRDDGSQDSTRDLLDNYSKKYPARITVIESDKRLGVKGNFSFLMENSTANYMMFADQDDVWEKDKVDLTLRKMLELENTFSQEEPLLVHTDLKVVDEQLKLLSPSFWHYIKLNPVNSQTLNRLVMQNVVTGCTMMINRALMKVAAPIPENSVMHDWWLALVAACFGKLKEISQPTILYRQHKKNTLGAQRFFSLTTIKNGLKKLNKPEMQKQAQVDELLLRYEERLNDDQKNILKAFKALPHVPFYKKIFLIFKFKLFKSGFLRNLMNILFKKY